MFARFRKDEGNPLAVPAREAEQDGSSGPPADRVTASESEGDDGTATTGEPCGEAGAASDAADGWDAEEPAEEDFRDPAEDDGSESAPPPSVEGEDPAEEAGEGQEPDPTSDGESAPPWRPRKFVPNDAPRRRRSRAMAPPSPAPRGGYTPQQRLLLLDTWQRSGLPAKDFAALVGIGRGTLSKWKQQFEKHGPEGLLDQPPARRTGSKLSEVTKRTILMLKEAHPEWGCERICDALQRGPALSASPQTVARVLREAGYERQDQATRPHSPRRGRSFERARPNQLWQTDLFTFMLKRQNRRLYLVAFLDDHSRFIVSYGLHASASTALVLEALEAGIANFGPPDEVLTDNGPQYVTWRGKSRFTKQLEKRGIRQIVARPRRPQTLGKIERFWGTLWRELIESAVFLDLADARARIGFYLDYYNFLRTHLGIGGLVPADRFFGAADDVGRALKERVSAQALELARHGQPKEPFYLAGQVSGQGFSVHAEGERIVLNREGEPRQEIELAGPPAAETAPAADLPDPVCPHAAPSSVEGEPAESPPPPPGTSAIDELEDALRDDHEQDQPGGAS